MQWSHFFQYLLGVTSPAYSKGLLSGIQKGPHPYQEEVLFPPNSSPTQDQDSGGAHQLLSWKTRAEWMKESFLVRDALQSDNLG